MLSKYIGIFDSGLGGLTAVKELMHLLPNEPIVYFGDTGRVPYGSKSNETIIKYTKSDVRFLNTFPLKLIIIACGTASSIALSAAKETTDVPVFGVVDAAAKAAVCATKNKRIGIIGTAGSVRSGAYVRKIQEQNPEIVTMSNPCPMFVPLVENGFTHGQVADLVAKEYLAPVKDAGVDTLILGCTHYPLLYDTIQNIMGKDVTLIDPGKVTAGFVKEYLEKNTLLNSETTKEQYRFFVSDCPDDFETLGSRFLGREVPGGVERIDIEKFM